MTRFSKLRSKCGAFVLTGLLLVAAHSGSLTHARDLTLAGGLDIMPDIEEPFSLEAIDRIPEGRPDPAELLRPNLAPPQASLGLAMESGHELWLLGHPGRIGGKTILRPDGTLLLQTVVSRDEVALTLPSMDVVNLRVWHDTIRVTVDLTATVPRSQVTFVVGASKTPTIDTDASLVHDVKRSDYGLYRAWRSSTMDPGWITPTMGLARVSPYAAFSAEPCGTQWGTALELLATESEYGESSLDWAAEALDVLVDRAVERDAAMQKALANLAPVDTHWFIGTVANAIRRAHDLIHVAARRKGAPGPAWSVDAEAHDLEKWIEERITTAKESGRTAAMVCQSWAAPHQARIRVAQGQMPPGLEDAGPGYAQPEQPPEITMNRYPRVINEPIEPWRWRYPRRYRVWYPWGWYWYWY